ncbi:hypothetical protein, partial [Sinorhizobium meliloti]|uniref:hypothetical protein n=1 Tax=Rhizobium meliloti TaxID=382 RepID=UPI001AECE35D
MTFTYPERWRPRLKRASQAFSESPPAFKGKAAFSVARENTAPAMICDLHRTCFLPVVVNKTAICRQSGPDSAGPRMLATAA